MEKKRNTFLYMKDLHKVVMRFSQDMYFAMRCVTAFARRHQVVCMPLVSLYKPLDTIDYLGAVLLKQLIKFKMPKQIYILVPVATWYPEEDHANFLLIDVQQGVCLRFEPHGGKQEVRVHWDKSSSIRVSTVEVQNIYAYLVKIERIVGTKIELYNAKTTCPHYGTQFAQEMWFEKNKLDIKQGLCVLISIMTMTEMIKRLRSSENTIELFREVQLQLGASNSPFDYASVDRAKLKVLSFVNSFKNYF